MACVMRDDDVDLWMDNGAWHARLAIREPWVSAEGKGHNEREALLALIAHLVSTLHTQYDNDRHDD
jgi:hypothetical protein